MVDIDSLCTDLHEEHASLDSLVVALDDEQWDLDTPAVGWTIRDQISHLAFFDEYATLSVVEPDRFNDRLAMIAADVDAFMSEPLDFGRALPPGEVLAWWRATRTQMLRAFWGADSTVRLPWFGPPMSLASFVTARIMETWAHGQDVADTLEVEREPTDRLKHVCHLGVRTRPNSYVTRGLEVPDEDVRVEVKAPSGEIWEWGDSTDNVVRGSALDFCLVVTQRRHRADTDLEIEGPLAQEWISIAQAFAGPPGSGRAPGQFNRPQP